MTIERLEELKIIRSDLQGNMELIIRTDDGEFNWDYGRELLEELLDDEIERQSVTDEEVCEAIQEMSQLYRVIQDKYSFEKSKRRAVNLAIEALRAYQPVRKNRTTEPVGKSDTLEECGFCREMNVGGSCENRRSNQSFNSQKNNA